MTASPASSSSVRQRPSSAPTTRRRPTGDDKIDATDFMPTADVSQAELDAWATLTRSCSYDAREYETILMHSRSRLTGALDRAHYCGRSSDEIALARRRSPGKHEPVRERPYSAKIVQNVDRLFDQFEHVGPAPLSSRRQQGGKSRPLLMARSKSGKMYSPGRTPDNYCIGYNPRAASASGRRQKLVADLEGSRKLITENPHENTRKNDQVRSDMSVRFLREHARKTQERERSFVKALRLEAKAQEDSQIEKIQRANQWARELGTGVAYLPRRVRGNLHVFKTENGEGVHRRRMLEGVANVLEEGCGKVISVESFLETDFVRIEKEYLAHRGDFFNVARRAVSAPVKQEVSKAREPQKTASGHAPGRPNAEETPQQLHRLIRDTTDLIEVLTAQAVELEGQNWNRTRGKHIKSSDASKSEDKSRLTQQQPPSPTEPLGSRAASTSCFSDMEDSCSPDLLRRGPPETDFSLGPGLRLSATREATTNSPPATWMLSRRTSRNGSSNSGVSSDLARTTTMARSLTKSARASTSQAAGPPASPLAVRNHESLAPSSPSSASSEDFWLFGSGKHVKRRRGGKGKKRRRDAESTTAPLFLPRAASRRRLPPVSPAGREGNRTISRFIMDFGVEEPRRNRRNWRDETSDATSALSSSSSSVSFASSPSSSSSLVDLSSAPPATRSEVEPTREVIDIADDSPPLQPLSLRRRSTLGVADGTGDDSGGGSSGRGAGEDEAVVEVPARDAPDEIVFVDALPISSRGRRARGSGVGGTSHRRGRTHQSSSHGSSNDATLVGNGNEDTMESTRRRGRCPSISTLSVARHRRRHTERSTSLATRLQRQEYLRQERSDAEMARRLQSEEEGNASRLSGGASAGGGAGTPAAALTSNRQAGRARVGSGSFDFSVSRILAHFNSESFLRMSLGSRDLTPADYEHLLSLDENDSGRSKGLSELDMSMLPQQKGNGSGPVQQCCICMEDMTSRQKITRLPACLHTFHSKCIMQWLKDNATCPIDKVSVSVNDA